MRYYTRLLFLLCPAIVSMMLVACAGASETYETTIPEDDTPEISIGLSFDSYVIERWIRDRDVFVARAGELGAEVNVQCAAGDLDEQISQIEYFIRKQVDVIVVVAIDCDRLGEVMRKAKDAGIKTISYDRLVHNANSDLYISFDNEKVGRLMGEALAKSLPRGGNIFAILGPNEDSNVARVEKGFMDAIAGKNINVVYSAHCEGWLSEAALLYVREALSLHKGIKAIMCGNDDLATQAYRALSEARLAGEVLLTGQDGDLLACRRIVEGTQIMTAYKSIKDEALLCAEYAVKLAKGDDIDDIRLTINDGAYNVPYLQLDPIPVTKDNIDEVIIGGGFHAREDVYRQ